MASRSPAAEQQTKRQNAALEATAPGDWGDLIYLLKQTGFELTRAMQAEVEGSKNPMVLKPHGGIEEALVDGSGW